MKKEHILIMRFSSLGDVAMTVPVVYSLAKAYPDVRITVLSRGYARAFFEDLAPNVSFMEADVKHEYHGIRGLNALYRRLTAKNFTAIADFHDVLRSEYLRMRFNVEGYRVAHIDKHRRLRKLLTAQHHKRLEQLPTPFKNYADTLARLGYPVTLGFRSIFPEEGGNLKNRKSEESKERLRNLRKTGDAFLQKNSLPAGKSSCEMPNGAGRPFARPGYCPVLQNRSFRSFRKQIPDTRKSPALKSPAHRIRTCLTNRFQFH